VTGGEDDMDLTAAGDFSLDDVLRGSSDVPRSGTEARLNFDDCDGQSEGQSEDLEAPKTRQSFLTFNEVLRPQGIRDAGSDGSPAPIPPPTGRFLSAPASSRMSLVAQPQSLSQVSVPATSSTAECCSPASATRYSSSVRAVLCNFLIP
jgi:hypothetical protein